MTVVRIVGAEFVVDCLEIDHRIAPLETARGIEHMNQYCGARDMAQEVVPESGAFGGALD